MLSPHFSERRACYLCDSYAVCGPSGGSKARSRPHSGDPKSAPQAPPDRLQIEPRENPERPRIDPRAAVDLRRIVWNDPGTTPTPPTLCCVALRPSLPNCALAYDMLMATQVPHDLHCGSLKCHWS